MSKLLVKTAHSQYVVDADEKTYARFPGETAPYQLRHPREIRTFAALDGMEVGDYLHIKELDGYWITSTEVKSIEPFTGEVAA